MSAIRWIRNLNIPIDAFEVFSMLRWMTGFTALVSWAERIVRAIRGDDVEEDWRTTIATSLFIAALSMGSAAQARESVALGGTVAEMRQLLREAAKDAEERDKRAAEKQNQLYKVTVKMAWVAGFTLLAAVVTLIVTVVSQ